MKRLLFILCIIPAVMFGQQPKFGDSPVKKDSRIKGVKHEEIVIYIMYVACNYVWSRY